MSDTGDYWRYDLFTHAVWMYVVFCCLAHVSPMGILQARN